MVRGVCEWVKQARSKIKWEWKKQKHTHCERSGWCNECVEIKAKQADTDSVLHSSGEQNSFQPDGGSPAVTGLHRGHGSSSQLPYKGVCVWLHGASALHICKISAACCCVPYLFQLTPAADKHANTHLLKETTLRLSWSHFLLFSQSDNTKVIQRVRHYVPGHWKENMWSFDLLLHIIAWNCTLTAVNQTCQTHVMTRRCNECFKCGCPE